MPDIREPVMLMHTEANRLARQLLRSRARARRIAPPSADAGLTLADGYDVAKCIIEERIAHGDIPVGRKLGFTDRQSWHRHAADAAAPTPIWGMLYASTVHFFPDNHGMYSITGMLQPRVEPEVIFGLRAAPAQDAGADAIGDCIEWMAHGFEIVVCPYPDWQFKAADAVAAFGLHGALLIGEQRSIGSQTRHHLAELLSLSSVSLSLTSGDHSGIYAAGFGSDVLGSPVHALLALHRLLQAQPQFPPLAAGEIVATGTWTDAHAIAPGETWSTAFSGVALPGLSVSFV